jgi:hypothetical protein
MTKGQPMVALTTGMLGFSLATFAHYQMKN